MSSSSSSPTEADTIRKKVVEFRSFISDVLIPKEAIIQQAETEQQDEIVEIDKLTRVVRTMKDAPLVPYMTYVDIGGGLSVQAAVDPPFVELVVHIGLGVLVSLPLDNVLTVCEKRRSIVLEKIELTRASLRDVRMHITEATDMTAELEASIL